MANMKCECGNRMSNVCCPNTLEGEIKGIYEYKSRNVWECEQCGRLYIDIDDPEVKGCHISKCYIPEDGIKGDLFDVGSGEDLINHLKKEWRFHKKEFLKIEAGEFD